MNHLSILCTTASWTPLVNLSSVHATCFTQSPRSPNRSSVMVLNMLCDTKQLEDRNTTSKVDLLRHKERSHWCCPYHSQAVRLARLQLIQCAVNSSKASRAAGVDVGMPSNVLLQSLSGVCGDHDVPAL